MRHRFSYTILPVLLLLCTCAFAQLPEMTGIGLSGAPSTLDSVVNTLDSVYVTVGFVPSEEWPVRDIGLALSQVGVVRFHCYDTPVPSGEPFLSQEIASNAFSLQIGTDILKFAVPTLRITDPYIRSLQVELALVARDSAGELAITETRVGFIPVGDVPALGDSVNVQNRLYLSYRDNLTLLPTLVSPQTGGAIGRFFDLRFHLPEHADSGSLYLLIRDQDPVNPELNRVLYFRDTTAGNDKVVALDASDLNGSAEVIRSNGPDTLSDGRVYSFLLGYIDIHRNPPEGRDTNEGITTDFTTIRPDFHEPRQGSGSSDSTILVHFFLREYASAVWLIFERSPSSILQDSLSPHILLLDPVVNGFGNQVFFIDGREIGSDGDMIEESNRGAHDRLISQVVYDVKLVYADTLGNISDTVTNRNYIWPDDRITIPPTIISPASGSRDNESFWVQFNLPEQPLVGSVRIVVAGVSVPPDPGSPHTIWLGNHASPGVFGFFLNALNLGTSQYVTSVTGPGTPQQNNTFIDQYRYLFRVVYQDAAGNPEATSLANFSGLDNSTLPPLIFSPASGDTFEFSGTELIYSQPDRAIPGTLKITLRQTSGPEYDEGSPHVLYLSDPDSGSAKSILIQGLQLVLSTGIDSIGGGPSLVARGVYELVLEYADSLNNPPGSARVFNLLFPSGSIVYARGGSLGAGLVEPGNSQMQAFRLELHTTIGTSALRGLDFAVNGQITPSELSSIGTKLWMSLDSNFDLGADREIVSAQSWLGGPLTFRGFAEPLDTQEKYFFVTLAMNTVSDPTHAVRLLLTGPESVDCGGDPVVALLWPLGSPDVPLPVLFTSIHTEQDTAFGALRVVWEVASETNNEGFNVLRRQDGADTFVRIASYTTVPALVGRGTSGTGRRYAYTDAGLVPGVRYFYRLEAVAFGGEISEYDVEAEGTPRIPPDNFSLSNAFPNPFNQEVTIEYVVPFSAEVTLTVYNLEGRVVRTLVRALQPPSVYQAHWDSRDEDGRDLPSGMYFYRLQAPAFDETKKLLLLR